MSLTEDFLAQEHEQEIIEAIIQAESLTSGEIRIHIEEHSDLDVLERASSVFFDLKMNETNARNGVLFYIGVADHSFAIIGDEGINQVVPTDFWECTRDTVIAHFKDGNYKEGIIAGVLRAGEQLKFYFPHKGGDKNELPNEISRG